MCVCESVCTFWPFVELVKIYICSFTLYAYPHFTLQAKPFTYHSSLFHWHTHTHYPYSTPFCPTSTLHLSALHLFTNRCHLSVIRTPSCTFILPHYTLPTSILHCFIIHHPLFHPPPAVHLSTFPFVFIHPLQNPLPTLCTFHPSIHALESTFHTHHFQVPKPLLTFTRINVNFIFLTLELCFRISRQNSFFERARRGNKEFFRK